MQSMMIAIPCGECGSIVWCTVFESEGSECPYCGASKIRSLYLLTAYDDRACDFFWNRLVIEEITRVRVPLYRLPRVARIRLSD